jgi:hypothetical protein
MAYEQPIWIPIVMWSALALGGLLALWALFWDRSRGRVRCPKCWHNMTGLAADANNHYTCPECGKSKLAERALRRTRRRRKTFLFALLIIAAGFCLPKAHRDGPASLIPSWVLVRLPINSEEEWWRDYAGWGLDKNASPVIRWHARELGERGLSEAQWRHWTGRVRDVWAETGRLGLTERDRAIDFNLRTTLLDRDYIDVPMRDVLADLSRRAGVKFVLDDTPESAIELPRPDERVTYHVQGMTIERALKRMSYIVDGERLVYQAWDWWIENDCIRLGSFPWPPKARVVQEYDLSDLIESMRDDRREGSEGDILSDDECSFELRNLIVNHVDPDGWVWNGGARQAIEFLSIGRLTIDANPRTHLAVERLLERIGRAIVQRDLDGARAQLDAFRAQLAQLESVTIPCTGQAITLGQCSDLIKSLSPIPFAGLEHDPPHEQDWRAHPIRLPDADLTLRELLDLIERQAPPDIWPIWTIHTSSLVLTEWEKSRMDLPLIIHDFGDLIDAMIDADVRSIPFDAPGDPRRGHFSIASTAEANEQLLEVIRGNVDSESWRVYGGGYGMTFLIDSHAFITHTRRNHVTIDDLLSRLRAVFIDGDAARERAELESFATLPAHQRDIPRIVLHDVRDLALHFLHQYVADAPVDEATHDPYSDPGESFGELLEPPPPVDFVTWPVMTMIRESIDPYGWRQAGGDKSTMDRLRGVLVIQTTPANHCAIDDLLTRLRAILLYNDPSTEDLRLADLRAQPQADDDGVRFVMIHDVADLIPIFRQADDPVVPESSDPGDWLIWMEQRALPVAQHIVSIIPADFGLKESDNPSTITCFGALLIISTTPDNHRAIAELLDQMRAEMERP